MESVIDVEAPDIMEEYVKFAKKVTKSSGDYHLGNDLAAAIKSGTLQLAKQDLRFLVDAYYQLQEVRKRFANQDRASEANQEPSEFANQYADLFVYLENVASKTLKGWVDRDEISAWAIKQHGIAHILAAGLRAHIDIAKAPTVGHIWSFAGQNDNNIKWLSANDARAVVKEVMGKEKIITKEHWLEYQARTGRKIDNLKRGFERICQSSEDKKKTKGRLIKALSLRPYNHRLKVICWKIGDSFVKTCNSDKSYYGKLYLQRKDYEQMRNDSGELADQAAEGLKRVNKSTVAYKYYKEGKLNPGHIDARARRYTVKLFLAHWHEVAYKVTYGKAPPKPYPIAFLGHAHYIPPPE